MLKYALFDYIPKRKMRKATFEQQDTTRRVLDFKAGKAYATRWAAREMARAIRHNDLSDTIIVCIPASCRRTNVRRYKQFMEELCELTGAINGFDLVQPTGKRRKAHIDHVHEIADGASECIHINDNELRGKKVLVVDVSASATGRYADNNRVRKVVVTYGTSHLACCPSCGIALACLEVEHPSCGVLLLKGCPAHLAFGNVVE